MLYNNEELIELAKFYQHQLLNDTVPFWFPRSFDKEHGGFLLMRDADGTLIDDDKAVWIQGRATWLLSTLYNTVEKKQEWLDGAKLGYDFLNNHCFDSDGQMFFHVTKEGNPIRKRRYFFSETFYVIAAAAYSKASGDASAAEKARSVFGRCIDYATIPGLLEPKYTSTRPSKGIGVSMIMMNTAQQLRENIGDPRCDTLIEQWISDIETNFVKDDIQCVMEQVAPDGSIIDHIDGRTLNPGHAIEGAWFILHEAKYRNNDQHLIELGCKMLDYMWERGWDKEYGGIMYFKDVYNKPVQEYWHDMKFWWPHNEVIIATLLAFLITGKEKYANWHKQVNDYAYTHFHDKINGEWYGYLHRQEWYCLQILQNHLKTVDAK